MIIVQPPAEPPSTFGRARTREGREFWPEDLVFPPLMVAFPAIMQTELRSGAVKRGHSKPRSQWPQCGGEFLTKSTWGYDALGMPGQPRNGTVYVYSNTVVNYADPWQRYGTARFGLPSHREGLEWDVPDVVDCRNNIFAALPVTPGAPPTFVSLVSNDGTINFGTNRSARLRVTRTSEIGPSGNGPSSRAIRS